MIKKIISGGQTGADQAGLDAAIDFGIDHGGWIPKGRLTEDGPLPDRYGLQEMSTKSYPKRTEQNVKDSDGTVIFARGKLSRGSALTRRLADKHNRPCLYIDLDRVDPAHAAAQLADWAIDYQVQTLNAAGSRESKHPGIHQLVFGILKESLRHVS